MSSTGTIGLLKELFLVAGGVVLSRALTYATVKNYKKLKLMNSNLCKISQAKAVPISDLRSLISTSSECKSESKEMLVVVRGTIEGNPRNWQSLGFNTLTSQVSKEKCVILEQTWSCDPSKESNHLYKKNDVLENSTSLHKIPFILRASGQKECYADILVNLEDSCPSPPLTLVFDVSQQKFSGILCPTRFTSSTEFLVKEKILPVGKELSAIGICSLHEEIPQIKACEELPCFLSEMDIDETVLWLRVKRDLLFVGILLLGVPTVIVVRCTMRRIWNLWKIWKQKKEK